VRVLLVVSASICALLGVVHVGFTFANYEQLSPAAVWFAGTGMALVLLAALNWATLAGPPPRPGIRRLVVGLDLLMVAHGVLAVRAVAEPPAYVVLATSVALTLSAQFVGRDPRRTSPS
jgi:hypothetical protein